MRRAVEFLGYLLFSVLLTLAFVGCATMREYQAEQAKWQGMADRATAALAPGRSVTILLKANGSGGRYLRQERTIELGLNNDPRTTERLLAHEISHFILGHVNAYLEQEMEANAFSVQVLQLWGHSEAEAVRWVENSRLNAQRAGDVLKGHDWCAEYRDLVRRYPQYPEPTGSAKTC